MPLLKKEKHAIYEQSKQGISLKEISESFYALVRQLKK